MTVNNRDNDNDIMKTMIMMTLYLRLGSASVEQLKQERVSWDVVVKIEKTFNCHEIPEIHHRILHQKADEVNFVL